jgi:hypothetical protein
LLTDVAVTDSKGLAPFAKIMFANLSESTLY